MSIFVNIEIMFPQVENLLFIYVYQTIIKNTSQIFFLTHRILNLSIPIYNVLHTKIH